MMDNELIKMLEIHTAGNEFWSAENCEVAMSWFILSTFCFKSSIYLVASTIMEVLLSCKQAIFAKTCKTQQHLFEGGD